MNLKIQFRLAILLLLMPLIALANTDVETIKSTKERTIKKSFNVASNATLKVKNSFGNLDIVTWNENRIEFDITIKVTGNNAEKVQDRLNRINIEFSGTRDLVSAITMIGKNEKNWWNWGKKINLKLEINYVIKMPITNNIDLSNDYGAINLDKLEGVAKISCDYGKITTKELMGDNNDIRFDYSNNCYFEYIKSGAIRADYSGFTVSKTNKLTLKADYTKSIIEASEIVNYTCDYGSLKIDNINNLQGQGDYLSLRLGNVFKNVDLKTNFGSIKIERIASKAKNITIKSDFTGITIGHDADYNFDFDIDLEFASLRESDGFNFTNKEVDMTEKKYNGYYGSQNSGNLVKIKSEYGSVTFKKL
ncbi:hypothetical protein [Winogradskyella sp. UBA3174]|uniref:hypothetical protein n=1 Tax=Winogradskyella sp. UBA3174 TaxID=1947785 RepID=UPI0025E46E5F|nr:hypothetical protein [Winogradskyella sp. UBA3174]|tara:strand:- start:15698 stop:16786 length:1089 start_codon:yes stop_codon:yes gene_type:complete